MIIAIVAVAFSACKHDREHDHGKHDEHSVLSMQLFVDGKQLGLQMKAHGQALHGFDHKPKTPDEKARFEKSISLLKKPGQLMQLPADKKCKIETSNATGNMEGHHYILSALFTASCETLLKPGWVSFNVGNVFKNVETIEIESESGAKTTVSATNGKFVIN